MPARRIAWPRTLRQLDAGLVALREGLGAAWSRTAVLVMTEFGRTVAVNGTGGTDHGTATVAVLLGGGAVAGGRVLGDWPGLAAGKLFEGRDLAPTLDLDTLIAVAAAESLRLDPELAMRTLFPGRPFTSRLEGLIAT